MWSLIWSKIADAFAKLLDEKQYKVIILFLIALFLVTQVYNVNQVTDLKKKLELIPQTIGKQDSALERRLNSQINQLYTDNSLLFEIYITTYKNDLSLIIDNTTNTNTALLKALIEKSSNETINEIRKIKINNRYTRPDSVSFKVMPYTFYKPLKDSLYASTR